MDQVEISAPILTFDETVAPSRTALVVIDVQNDLCGPHCLPLLPQLKALIQIARDAGVYVVYVQHSTLPDGLSNSASLKARRRIQGMGRDLTVEGTPGYDLVEEIAPLPGDPIVRKHRMNSFLGTDLDMLLRCKRIETVVTTGVSTHACVLNTSCAAIGNDYYVVVVEDCVGSRKTEVHEAALTVLRDSVHYVVDSRQLIDTWQRRSNRPAGA